MQVEEYRGALERFHEARQREEYLYYSGRKPRLELAGIYAEHSDLYSDAAIADLDRELARFSSWFESQIRSLRKLRGHAVEQQIERSALEVDEALADFEGRRTAAWGGRDLPFRALSRHAAREPDAASRRRLGDLRIEALAQSNPLRRERREARRIAARRLGFASEIDARASASGIDGAALGEAAGRLLEATRGEYMDRLASELEAATGLGLPQARRSDFAFWERSRMEEQSAAFPKGELLETLRATLAPLGLDLARQTGLAIELDAADARPFCAAPRIPDDVRIVLAARDGARDYGRLLHEAGHAEHFVCTSPRLAAEHRLLGDRALGEGFAFLLEDLLVEASWLGSRLEGDALCGFVRTRALARAHDVRCEAGKLLAAAELERDPPSERPDREAAAVLSDAAGVVFEADESQEACDDPLASASYLRGWSLAAALRELLRAKFGWAWFRSRAAGKLLREAWDTGQLYTADELARELGAGPVELGRLADEIRQELCR